MEANIFPLKEVGDFYNANFINVKMDMEKGEGIELAKKFKIRAFPTLLFLDPEGNIVHKRLGAAGTAEGFNEIGKTALDDTKNTSSWDKKYQAGERSTKFIADYIDLKAGLYEVDKAKELFDWYFATTPKKEFLNEKGFNTIMKNAGLASAGSDFIFDNKAKYEEILGKKLATVLLEVQGRNLVGMATSRRPGAAKEYKEKSAYLKEKLGTEYSQIGEYVEWNIQTIKDPKVGFTKALAYMDKYQAGDLKAKTGIAMQMAYTKGLDANDLKAALEIVEMALKADKNNLMKLQIQAALYYRLGKAKKVAKLEKKIKAHADFDPRSSFLDYVMKNFKSV